MAPEQIRGDEADARTDVFAFGAVLYEMLSGRRTFSAASEPELVAAILEREPPPISDIAPSIPSSVDGVIAACLAKDPAERWHHARDVRLALRAIAEGRSSSPPRTITQLDTAKAYP